MCLYFYRPLLFSRGLVLWSPVLSQVYSPFNRSIACIFMHLLCASSDCFLTGVVYENATCNLCFPKAYIKKVETVDMVELGRRLVDAKNCLSFLIECATFSPADIRLNNNVFQWYGRMEEIFDEHRRIMAEKTEQYQEGLKVGTTGFQTLPAVFTRLRSTFLGSVAPHLSQAPMSAPARSPSQQKVAHAGAMGCHFLIFFQGRKHSNALPTHGHL